MVFLITDPPDISESSSCERALARLAEREGNIVGGWEDPV